MAHLDLSNIAATIVCGSWKPALVTSTTGAQQRRVMPGTIVIEVPLSSEKAADAFDAVIPKLKEQMDAVASRVEDGGTAMVAKAKAKIPPVSLVLRYKDDASDEPALSWPIAESTGIDVRVDAKGDGIARTKWRVRLSKKDMGTLHDAAGADMIITAVQSQMTPDELGKRKDDEGKAPNANPFKAARNKKKGAQAALPLDDAQASDATDKVH